MFAKWHYIYYAYVPAMLRLFCGRYEKKKKISYSYVQGTMSGINIFYLKLQTPLSPSSIVLTLKMMRL